MNVLAIDTASPATAVAVARSGRPPVGAWEDAGPAGRPRHSTLALELAADLMQRAGLSWQQLDLVAVGTGPGTYTGLRIGIATAKGLARSAGAKLVGVGTLRTLAAGAADDAVVLAVLDARRGEAFAARWQGGEEARSPVVLAAADLAALVERGCSGVGPGAIRWRSQLEAAGATVAPDQSPCHKVDARVICRLAREGSAGPPEPEYLRLADAEIALRAERSRG